MASYLFDACREVIVETHERELLDDLDLDELVTSIRSGRIKTVVFRTRRVDVAEEWRLDLPLSESGSKTHCSLALTVCDNGQPWTQVEWLQASFDHPTPFPTLAIPRGPDGVSASVFHGLVVLAARFGQVEVAVLGRGESPERAVTVARMMRAHTRPCTTCNQTTGMWRW
jgi:hypothetical protein